MGGSDNPQFKSQIEPISAMPLSDLLQNRLRRIRPGTADFYCSVPDPDPVGFVFLVTRIRIYIHLFFSKLIKLMQVFFKTIFADLDLWFRIRSKFNGIGSATLVPTVCSLVLMTTSIRAAGSTNFFSCPFLQKSNPF